MIQRLFILLCIGTCLLFSSKIGSAMPEDPASDSTSPDIRLNQIGFYPSQHKLAVVEKRASGSFCVINHRTEDTILTGTLSNPTPDIYSGKMNAIADFSTLNKPGAYYLYVPSLGNSAVFSISDKVYQALGKGVLKAYYFLRCSAPLSPGFAGKWARAEGHPDTVVYVHSSAASVRRPTGTVISSPGGWYDAGDYNKYIVNSGITLGTLLSAYEDFTGYFDTLSTHIPESNNRLPDILDEALWNLRWMLTMQDPNDGGVYHKLTDSAFDKMEMPDQDHPRRFVVMKSTAATLDFAAVMAQSARIFRSFTRQLPGLSDSCLQAASSAWQWAVAHPDVLYDQQQMNQRFTPVITTGAYGDRHVKDEKYWAAVELFITTGDRKYQRSLRLILPQTFTLPSWGQVGTLGDYTLLRFRKKLKGDKTLLARIQKRLIMSANRLLDHPDAAYQTVMGGTAHDFIWGSNAVAANQGILMIQAYLLTRDKKYLKAARGNLDYLLGRNATGYCFVTGFGSKSPMHPHHRPSVADGIKEPVPGLLVGGPNPGQQDHCPTYPSRIADESYTDDDRAYACNEIAINWNAPMVYLVNALEALSL